MTISKSAILGIVCTIFGFFSCFLPWTQIPIIGEAIGIQSYEGKLNAIVFIILGILFGFNKFKNKWITILLSLISILSTSYYMYDLGTIRDQADSVSRLTMFGSTIGDGILNADDFTIKQAVYITTIMGIGCLIGSLTGQKVDMEDDNFIEENIVSENESQINIDNGVGGQNVLAMLERLLELKEKGLISNELYEKEAQPLLKNIYESDDIIRENKIIPDQVLPNVEMEESSPQFEEKQNEPIHYVVSTDSKYSFRMNILWFISLTLVIVGVVYYCFEGITKVEHNKETSSASNVKSSTFHNISSSKKKLKPTTIDNSTPIIIASFIGKSFNKFNRFFNRKGYEFIDSTYNNKYGYSKKEEEIIYYNKSNVENGLLTEINCHTRLNNYNRILINLKRIGFYFNNGKIWQDDGNTRGLNAPPDIPIAGMMLYFIKKSNKVKKIMCSIGLAQNNMLELEYYQVNNLNKD